jgi:hypothetical protein
MRVWGYEEGLGDEGNWIVHVGSVASAEAFDWLEANLEWFRFTGAGNLVVGSETDAMLVYLRFK